MIDMPLTCFTKTWISKALAPFRVPDLGDTVKNWGHFPKHTPNVELRSIFQSSLGGGIFLCVGHAGGGYNAYIPVRTRSCYRKRYNKWELLVIASVTYVSLWKSWVKLSISGEWSEVCGQSNQRYDPQVWPLRCWLFSATGFVKSFELVIFRVIRICSGARPVLAFVILKMMEDSSIISHHPASAIHERKVFIFKSRWDAVIRFRECISARNRSNRIPPVQDPANHPHRMMSSCPDLHVLQSSIWFSQLFQSFSAWIYQSLEAVDLPSSLQHLTLVWGDWGVGGRNPVKHWGGWWGTETMASS